MGLDPARLATDDVDVRPATVRPGRVVLDTSLAASYGLRCRSLDEALG